MYCCYMEKVISIKNPKLNVPWENKMWGFFGAGGGDGWLVGWFYDKAGILLVSSLLCS